MGISKELRQVMKEKGITQKELARARGVSVQTIRNTLYKDSLKVSTLEKYCELLGVKIALIAIQENKEN